MSYDHPECEQLDAMMPPEESDDPDGGGDGSDEYELHEDDDNTRWDPNGGTRHDPTQLQYIDDTGMEYWGAPAWG